MAEWHILNGGYGHHCATAQGTTTPTTTRQKLYATRYLLPDPIISLILDTEAISSMILTPTVQNYAGVAVSNAYITECHISTLLEIHTGARRKHEYFYDSYVF